MFDCLQNIIKIIIISNNKYYCLISQKENQSVGPSSCTRPKSPRRNIVFENTCGMWYYFQWFRITFHLKHQVQVDTFLKSEAFTIKLDFRKYPCYSHGWVFVWTYGSHPSGNSILTSDFPFQRYYLCENVYYSGTSL